MERISQNRIPIHITAQAIMFCVIFLCYPQLSAQVDTAWVRTYNGSGEQWDRGAGIEVDREGNIYVLGQANGDEIGNGDIVVIKYTPEGETTWARIYDAPGENSRDLPIGIASDSLGNVYVSEVTNYGRGDNFTTLRYLANGDTAWLRQFDGPEHLGDFPHKLQTDHFGNVIILGECDGESSVLCVVKYLPNGDTAWSRVYADLEGPAFAMDIDIDDEGNIYITGSGYASWETYRDAVTIKYHPNGDTAWIRRYEGIANSDDAASGITVNDSGYVFVAGSTEIPSYQRCSLLIKYDPNGNTVWVTVDSGSTAAYFVGLDPLGNIYAAGNAITKYDPNGSPVWRREYGRPNSRYDLISAFLVDSEGNSYATGQSWLDDSHYDYLTMKFDANGELLWSQEYNGQDNSVDEAWGLAVDGFNNVYVTGVSYSLATYNDIVTIRYVQTPTGIVEASQPLPMESGIFQNYPNPFNGTTALNYALKEPGRVSLTVYNLLGQKVARLVDSFRAEGQHSAIWNAEDVPSGIYFALLESSSHSWAIKLTLIK